MQSTLSRCPMCKPYSRYTQSGWWCLKIIIFDNGHYSTFYQILFHILLSISLYWILRIPYKLTQNKSKNWYSFAQLWCYEKQHELVEPIADKFVCYLIFNILQWQEMRYYPYQMAFLRGNKAWVSQKELCYWVK